MKIWQVSLFSFMTLAQRLATIIHLGEILQSLSEANHSSGRINEEWNQIIEKAENNNNWFTSEWISFAFKAWGDTLSGENVSKWVLPYHLPDFKQAEAKKILLIMAGNIPLVGLHDFLCTFVCGHITLAKLSSKDAVILPWLISILEKEYPGIDKYIKFVSGDNIDADAVIATGSDASRVYFEYSHQGIPKLIRGNRNSIAVLTGKESEEEIAGLALDIKAFFGLGCRSVSLVFTPDIVHIETLAQQLRTLPLISSNRSYSNNMKQQAAILTQNNIRYLNADNVLITENNQIASPIGVIYYNIYKNQEEVNAFLKQNDLLIQCIAGDSTQWKGAISFGQSQFPSLWDYADGADTVNFLSAI
ncbi:MAG: acyl-CoA reductase [Bacteroidetes bacterium]|nr:acyl-CoA reductase [Bacteroidota bacterium]